MPNQQQTGIFYAPGLAQLLYENKRLLVWQNLVVAAGQSSAAALLRRERGAYYPFGFSVEVAFSANPGTFQLDIQTADTDSNAYYVTLASLTQTNINSSNVCRAEAVNVWAKYVRLQMVALGNAVSVTAGITR